MRLEMPSASRVRGKDYRFEALARSVVAWRSENLSDSLSVLDGLCALCLSPCLDGDALRAAQKSLLQFVLQYVPG